MTLLHIFFELDLNMFNMADDQLWRIQCKQIVHKRTHAYAPYSITYLKHIYISTLQKKNSTYFN